MGASPEDVKAALLAQLENPHLTDEEIARIEKKLQVLKAETQ